MSETKGVYGVNLIEQIHALVWQFRKDNSDWWLTPEPDDCIRYAFTEAGELMDAYLRSKRTGDARNNDKLVEIDHELADVAIMLVSALLGDIQPAPEMYSVKRDIDGICMGMAWIMKDMRRHDVIYLIEDITTYAKQNHIDIVAQVQRNLEAIRAKHEAEK